MGVSAVLFEITPSELAAARADIAVAVKIVETERRARTGRPECDLGKAFGGLFFLFSRGRYREEVMLLDYERSATRTAVGDIILVDPDDTDMMGSNFEMEDLRREHIARFFDPQEMAGIYPDVWQDPGELEWLLRQLSPLRTFFLGAASRGAGVLSVCG